MQYKSNPADGFRDMDRKQNTDAQTHGRTARHGDDNILRPYFVGEGLKNILLNFLNTGNCKF